MLGLRDRLSASESRRAAPTSARRLALALGLALAAPACGFSSPPVLPGDGKPPGDAPVDAVVIGDASSDWWDATWLRRRKITIRHTELTGPVQTFPLLVKLPVGVGMASGDDLRFLATDQRTV